MSWIDGKYQIAGLSCSFAHFGTGGFWDLWQWKLNPYLTTELGDAQLMIQQKTFAEHYQLYPGTMPLLMQEHSGFFTRSVYRLGEQHTLWTMTQRKDEASVLLFLVDSDWSRVTLLKDYTNSAGSAAFEYLAQMMPAMFLKKGLLTIHAALMEYKGVAIAVSAPSGTGKTTHAHLWRDRRNALILNGDRAVLGPQEKGWIAYGTPWSGTSGEQINRSAPMGALVLLEQGEENQVKCLSAAEALPLLLPQVLYPDWDRELVGIAMDLLDRFLKEVPVFLLCCRPDREAVDVLEEELKRSGIWK